MADDRNDTNKAAAEDAASLTRPPADGAAMEPQSVPPYREVAADPSHASEPLAIGPAVTGSTDAAGTEWTASDAREPLGAATPVGSEPFEPAHEAAVPPFVEQSTRRSAPAHDVMATPRRSIAGPVFAGLVIGALIGAGSAAVVYRLTPTTGQGDGSSVSALSTRVDALDRRPDPQSAIADLKGSVGALDGRLAALRTSVAALQQARQQGGAAAPQGQPTLQASPPSAGGQTAAPAFDPAPLQQKIAALQGGVDALRKDDAAAKGDAHDVQGKFAGIAAALALSQKQAAAAQDGVRDVQGQQKSLLSEQQGLQSQQKALEGKLNAPALAVVSDSLVQQIALGLPYATQVDALAAIGADPARVAILRQGADKGVPTAKALGESFEPLADSLAATDRKTPPGTGFMARMEAGFFSLVSVRSTTDTTGSSAASKVSRIQADLAHDDVGDAYATWQALPDDAKAKSQAWGALAKTQTEAMAAARALQHDAIAALGTKKS